LDALGADAEMAYAGARTFRAGIRRAPLVAAVVADQTAHVIGVEGERHVAARTARHVAAVAAEDEGAEAAPVDEEDDLLGPREALRDRLAQLLGEDRRAPETELLAEIDDAHLRQRPIVDPPRQVEPANGALLGAVERLD